MWINDVNVNYDVLRHFVIQTKEKQENKSRTQTKLSRVIDKTITIAANNTLSTIHVPDIRSIHHDPLI